jgi:hypothetical protein
MGVLYQRGQELTDTDLRMFLKDRNGNGVNVYEVLYSLYYYDPSTKEYTAVSGQVLLPADNGPATGQYWVAWDIPYGQPCGQYQVRWDFKTSVNAPYQQTRSDFAIVKYPVGTYRTAEVSDLPGNPIVIIT